MNLLCKLFGHKILFNEEPVDGFKTCKRCGDKVEWYRPPKNDNFVGYQPRQIENENGKPPIQFSKELEKEDPKFFVKEYLPYDVTVRLQKLNDMLDGVL